MTDELVTGQGSESDSTPDTGVEQSSGAVETPRMLRVGGKEMTEDQLVKSYEEAQRKITELGQKATKDDYSWAEQIRDAYYKNPAFKRQFDEAWEVAHSDQATTPTNVLSPEYQELRALKVDVEMQKQERAFDKLRQKGYSVSDDDENAVRTLMATSRRFDDAEVAYKHLFFDREREMAAKNATVKTAEKMAENRGAYNPLPSGTTRKPAIPDPRKMSPKQFENVVLEKLREAGIE